MSWTDIFSGGVDKLVGSVSEGLDSLFTSDEERATAKLLIQKEVNNFKGVILAAKAQEDKEITERWKSDNEHGVTRLVRPISYFFVLLMFAFLVFFDGNVGQFKVNPVYIPVIEGLLITMTIAYFGSRGIEKVTKSIKAVK